MTHFLKGVNNVYRVAIVTNFAEDGNDSTGAIQSTNPHVMVHQIAWEELLVTDKRFYNSNMLRQLSDLNAKSYRNLISQ